MTMTELTALVKRVWRRKGWALREGRARASARMRLFTRCRFGAA
jgi:hypothetical protein